MIFYKIVRKRSKYCKDLLSVVKNSFSIKYKTQRWRKPILKGSKIFVFDTLENANTFLLNNRGYNLVIYECEVQNPVKATSYAFCADDFSITEYWKGLKHDNFKLPIGTYFVDKIKLTKRVQ